MWFCKRGNTNEKCGGSSIRGVSHKATHTPNQDSFGLFTSKYGTTLVVADGVGSHKYSKCGSKAAVKAVKNAFRLFETEKLPVSNITATIYSLFQSYVPKRKRSQASTTCIFVHISPEHGTFIGQAGDGACYFKINDKFSMIVPPENEFANLVQPINPEKTIHKWKTRHLDTTNEDTMMFFLSSDGISNDIIPGKEYECLEFYASKLVCDKRKNNRFVHQIIKHWDVPGSVDDKTMIVYSRGISDDNH